MKKLSRYLSILILIGFFLVPVYVFLSGNTYALVLFGRILVFALAALGLNLALGFGGMISFGHAMYIGFGAYTAGIMSLYGLNNGWAQLLVMFAFTGVMATLLGWVALRTRDIAFIMITLAFAQLFFFVFMGLEAYGGDDGMSLRSRSQFGFLSTNPYALYYSTAISMVLVYLFIGRVVNSRFGLVLRATRINEERVNAIGTSSLSYRLLAYVLSAQICALAGFFYVNLTGFVSPAYMDWTVSGELIVMVLLGGMGTVFGPVVGAAALLLFEELLKSYTQHWPLVMGPAILLMVVFLRKGLWGIFKTRSSNAAVTSEAS
ncbi:MAG TPA: branched-chain amino acid ABC transporter permease [Burkholderiaceae bacterium]|nr:branched-chain amino acid ABC transporter permease [Burkholderiaceae bacterium]